MNIMVKLVARCTTVGCDEREEYEIALSMLKVDTDACAFDGHVQVNSLPNGWEWHHYSWVNEICPTCPSHSRERRTVAK